MEWRARDAARRRVRHLNPRWRALVARRLRHRGARATIAARWPVRPLYNLQTNADLDTMTVDTPFSGCHTPRMLLLVFFGNTLVATVLWLAAIGDSFADLWLLSQSIGLAITLIHIALQRLGAEASCGRWRAVLGVALGATTGIALAYWLGFFPKADDVSEGYVLLRVTAMALIIGAVAAAFFHNVQRLAELKIEQQAAQLNELKRQKEAATAHLKLLQAQIEPHFLFNTLANLHSLIGTDDGLARRLLERLDDYLRASLDHSRSASGTLADECRLLAAYLDIQALRMGQRLRWTIDVPAQLGALPLPPMLVQPLVENAIRHGIEPRVGTGRVTLTARAEQRRLHLCVSDDGLGLGLDAGTHRHGVGLANVRERLAAVYGANAELVLRENQPTGVTAELWIPLPDPAH